MESDTQLARLNKALALERLGGDEELLQELAGLFLEEYPALIDKLRAAIDAQDAHAIERAAHSLKGSVGNFGAERAHRAALDLEMIGRNGNVADARQSFAKLEAAMNDVQPEILSIAETH